MRLFARPRPEGGATAVQFALLITFLATIVVATAALLGVATGGSA